MTTQRRAIAIAFAALPIAFGIFRALQTRSHDLRMLWMAIAATVGAMIVRAIAKKHTATITFIVATLFAGTTAYALGARAWFGIWAVAAVFGICWAVSAALRKTDGRASFLLLMLGLSLDASATTIAMGRMPSNLHINKGKLFFCQPDESLTILEMADGRVLVRDPHASVRDVRRQRCGRHSFPIDARASSTLRRRLDGANSSRPASTAQDSPAPPARRHSGSTSDPPADAWRSS